MFSAIPHLGAGYTGIVQDVTDRRMAEACRMLGEQLVADVMEIADQGRSDAALAQTIANVRDRGRGQVGA